MKKTIIDLLDMINGLVVVLSAIYGVSMVLANILHVDNGVTTFLGMLCVGRVFYVLGKKEGNKDENI